MLFSPAGWMMGSATPRASTRLRSTDMACSTKVESPRRDRKLSSVGALVPDGALVAVATFVVSSSRRKEVPPLRSMPSLKRLADSRCTRFRTCCVTGRVEAPGRM